MHRLLFTALLFCLEPAADAQMRTNFKKEEGFLKELVADGPDAMADYANGVKLMEEGKYAEAAKMLDNVLKVNAFFPPALRRLGLCYAFTGHRKEGLTLLETAVERERSSDNLTALARGLAGKPPHEGTPAEKEKALHFARESAEQYRLADDPAYIAYVAYLSWQLDREDLLDQAVEQLKKRFPITMEAHYYVAVLASVNGDTETMKTELARAKQTGMTDEMAAAIQARPRRNYGWILGAVVLLALAGGWIMFRRSKAQGHPA